MRLLLVAALATALAAPALASEIDPSDLVLHQADVPAGFSVDKDDTGVRSNSTEAAGNRQARDLFARSGRVTGYEAEFDRGEASISSRVDVFRTSAGARMMFRFVDRELQRSGIAVVKRSRSRVGAEAWVYRGRASVVFAVVVWRQGRVFAGIAGQGISVDRTLALARAQERRIAAGLR